MEKILKLARILVLMALAMIAQNQVFADETGMTAPETVITETSVAPEEPAESEEPVIVEEEEESVGIPDIPDAIGESVSESQ